jgi:hypothetical protein
VIPVGEHLDCCSCSAAERDAAAASAIAALLGHESGVLDAPPGSGKTEMAYAPENDRLDVLRASSSRRMFSTTPVGVTPASKRIVRSRPPVVTRTSAEKPGSAISASGSPSSASSRQASAPKISHSPVFLNARTDDGGRSRRMVFSF